jgi:hypothetical protein
VKYITEEQGAYYLIDKVRCGDEWKEKKTEITDSVTVSDLDKYRNDTTVESESTYLPCFNPYCNNVIRVTKKQKRDLLLSFQKKYKKVVFVTCSDECQDVVLNIFSADAA